MLNEFAPVEHRQKGSPQLEFSTKINSWIGKFRRGGLQGKVITIPYREEDHMTTPLKHLRSYNKIKLGDAPEGSPIRPPIWASNRARPGESRSGHVFDAGSSTVHVTTGSAVATGAGSVAQVAVQFGNAGSPAPAPVPDAAGAQQRDGGAQLSRGSSLASRLQSYEFAAQPMTSSNAPMRSGPNSGAASNNGAGNGKQNAQKTKRPQQSAGK